MLIQHVCSILEDQGRIAAGPKTGQKKYYHDALLSCLHHLRPKACLEIGTCHGHTARVFVGHFDAFAEGVLVTADIKKYVDLAHPRIRQVQVYPHAANYKDFHYVEEDELLADRAIHYDSSVAANAAIIERAMGELGITQFDFALIDGDHQAASLRKDLEIVRRLTRPPHYALIDDVWAWDQECSHLYHDFLKNEYGHYDFDDWPVLTDCALVWEKQS